VHCAAWQTYICIDEPISLPASQAVAPHIALHKGLTSLVLSLHLQAPHAPALGAVLSANRAIEWLELIGNRLRTQAAMAAVSAGLAQLSALTHLDIAGQFMEDAAIAELAVCFSNLKQLQDLDVSEQLLTDAGVGVLAQHLPELTRLSRLIVLSLCCTDEWDPSASLSWVHDREMCRVDAVASPLGELTRLADLDLCGNLCDEQSVAALEESLPKLTRLTQLHISCDGSVTGRLNACLAHLTRLTLCDVRA
jgi:hypothetical protein